MAYIIYAYIFNGALELVSEWQTNKTACPVMTYTYWRRLCTLHLVSSNNQKESNVNKVLLERTINNNSQYRAQIHTTTSLGFTHSVPNQEIFVVWCCPHKWLLDVIHWLHSPWCLWYLASKFKSSYMYMFLICICSCLNLFMSFHNRGRNTNQMVMASIDILETCSDK